MSRPPALTTIVDRGPPRTPAQRDRLRRMVGNIGNAYEASELLGITYHAAARLLKEYRKAQRTHPIPARASSQAAGSRVHGDRPEGQ